MIILFFILHLFHRSSQFSCSSKIFCHGPLLHTVQMSRVFPDSKTFVDLKLIHDEERTLHNFNKLRKMPSRKQIKEFLLENFEKHIEFESWTPPDFTPSPEFLKRISEPRIRNFAQSLVNIWPQLARKVKVEVLKSPHLYTILPVDNGFVVPGGRFREFYYWDSYWIIEGLLLCEMYQTVRGMLDNFASMVQRYGFIPNGFRIYYLNRTQPPLFTLMVAAYIDATNDTDWLTQNIKILEQELHFFLKHRVTEVLKNGTKYLLAHYVSHDGTPRPESYYEDIKTASPLCCQEKRHLFAELKGAAESGWDFSSRWIVNPNGGADANLTHTHTRRIIPVDLNSFLCQAFRKMSEFYVILRNYQRTIFWMSMEDLWRKNIQEVFYHEEDGIWYDWDKVLSKPRRLFYPSNFAPLWSKVYDLAHSKYLGRRAAEYLIREGVLEFRGGVPTSLIQSGEQWDYPNAWPPLQAMVIFGLDQSDSVVAQKVAEFLAQQWVESNLVCFFKTHEVFEKYSAKKFGKSGQGGEYAVQSGFGWTNGVLFQLINRYYTQSQDQK